MKADFEYPLNYFLNKLSLTTGKFVDVGANDGIKGSMTYDLENKGWTGILIEPNPTLVERLKSIRKSPVFPYALSSVEGELPFYIVEGPDNLHGLSRFDYTEEFEAHVKSCGGVVHKKNIQVKKLSHILEECPQVDHIDLLKIDVEGHEFEVLKSFDFKKYSPRLIVTEDNFKDANKSVRNLLAENGYVVVARDRINYWFAKSSDIKFFYYDYLHAQMRFLRWDLKRFFYKVFNKKVHTGNH